MPKTKKIHYDKNDLGRLEIDTPVGANDRRTEFERDRSRIIHSAAFRRLQSKTQVYGLGASDYYRTRLTHSLEVAQIGKALALRFEADPDLVEAICLAHDIGHPPFGHAGEQALHKRLDPKADAANEGFNGNAQNLRIVTDHERKSTKYAGLNLTRATLDGLIKYPWAIGSKDPEKKDALRTKGFYRSDEPLVKKIKLMERKTFECQLMNWADDVAYSSHDLEDALVIGTIGAHDLERNFRRISDHAQTEYRKEYPEKEKVDRLDDIFVQSCVDDIMKECVRPGYSITTDRIATIKTFVGRHIDRCVTEVDVQEHTDAKSPRYSRSLVIPTDIAKRVEVFKAVVFTCVILTAPVLTLQNAGRRIIVDLYNFYSDWESWTDKKIQIQLFPADWRNKATDVFNAIEADTKLEADRFKQQFARDFVAGMTDRYAESTWKRLNQPGDSSLFVARF